MARPQNIIIIGGGAAGLIAARELARSGRPLLQMCRDSRTRTIADARGCAGKIGTGQAGDIGQVAGHEWKHARRQERHEPGEQRDGKREQQRAVGQVGAGGSGVSQHRAHHPFSWTARWTRSRSCV